MTPLQDLRDAAGIAAIAPHFTTLEVKRDGIDVFVRGHPASRWPNRPATSQLVTWAEVEARAEGRNPLADVISTLNQRVTDLVAERLQQEGEA